MKKITLSAIAALTLFACGNGENETSTNVTLTNNIDTVSYVYGTNIGNSLLANLEEGNFDAFKKGLQDVLDSADLMVSTEEGQVVIQAYAQKKQMEEITSRARSYVW